MSLGTKRDFREWTRSTPSPLPSPQRRPRTAAAGEREKETYETLTQGAAYGSCRRQSPGLSSNALCRALYGRRGSCRVTISKKMSNCQVSMLRIDPAQNICSRKRATVYFEFDSFANPFKSAVLSSGTRLATFYPMPRSQKCQTSL